MTSTPRTAADAYAAAERHGWADAIARIVDDAPPVPADAVDILRDSGFPARRKDAA